MAKIDDIIAALDVQDPYWHGWCHPEKARRIYDTIVSLELKHGLEIGAYAGKSVCAAGAGFEQTGGGLIGIDPWSKAEATIEQEDGENKNWWGRLNFDKIKQQAQDSLKRFGLGDHVRLEQTDSRGHFLQTWMQYVHNPLDYLHIDGCHSQWNSCHDVISWVPLVKENGIIFMDDEEWESTFAAQHLLHHKCEKLDRLEYKGCLCGIYRKKENG